MKEPDGEANDHGDKQVRHAGVGEDHVANGECRAHGRTIGCQRRGLRAGTSPSAHFRAACHGARTAVLLVTFPHAGPGDNGFPAYCGAEGFTTAVRRVGTRLLIETIRVVFALLVGWGCAYALQGPIESTCGPNPLGDSGPTGTCAGLSGLSGALLGFFGALILSLLAERLWRRRRKRRFDNPS